VVGSHNIYIINAETAVQSASTQQKGTGPPIEGLGKWVVGFPDGWGKFATLDYT